MGETLEQMLESLAEYRYQLRLEHNHSDMRWYAYFSGKEGRLLFDKDIDWKTSGDTPTEAVNNLLELRDKVDRYSL